MNCSIEARLLGVSWCNLNLPEVSFFCLERGQIMLTELGLWGTDMVSAYTIFPLKLQGPLPIMRAFGLKAWKT